MDYEKEAPGYVETLQPQTSHAEGHLEKRFSKLTMTGMAFAILNTWIALASTLAVVLPSGGPVAFVYGFIFCVLCNFCLAGSMGEMASVWPTAGGQYHWAYALSSDTWKNSMSFLVGWINIAGWLTLVTTEAIFGSLFLSAATVVGSGFTLAIQPWQTYLFFLAISFVAIMINIFGYPILDKWNQGALFWSLSAFVATAATIVATAPKTSPEFVFTAFTNQTGYSDGTAWILGLLQSALSLIGFDAVAHMTEEMPRPTKDAPQAMLMCIAIGGTTGTFMIISLLFCIPNPDKILATTTGQPLIELIYQSTGSRVAAIILACGLTGCFINGTMGSVASGSRLLWAMGRDGGAPFSKWLAHVNPRFNIPINAILACALFNIVFGLLYLGPAIAFNAYISSCTIFLNCSYAAPILILIIRGRKIISKDKPDFYMGYWKGWVVNVVAVVFVGVTSVFFMFPAAVPVDANTMNYVSAVVGIFIIFVTVLWLFKRKTYQGPIFDNLIPDMPHPIHHAQ